MKNDLFERARELALLFTRWPSVTGSPGDAAFAELAVERLQHFDKAWALAIPGDYAGRSNFFALKRGKARRTIVLTGHFDVVSIEDYGALAELAFKPESLLPKLITRLRTTAEHGKALADLESGDFIPGRGLLDMKAGLAAGLAAMEAYAGDATLLFVGVSDEEEKSAGARAAVPQVQAIALEHGLDIALVINLDAISDQGDGSKGRVVTFGSIGKQLLAAYVVGKQAHAGYPKDGVNAAYVMAELVRALELAPDLAEITGAEVAAVPATLQAKDSKQGYNVTTPGHAFTYWNTMQHRRSGAEVLAIAERLCAVAVQQAEARTGHRIKLLRWADVAVEGGKAQLHDQSLDLPEQTRRAMAASVRGMGLTEPTVILGFASIPYPAVLLQNQGLRDLISRAVRHHGLGEINYFAGISDMSFFGEASGDLAVVKANTPIWGTGFDMPEPAGYPCINIGPWGRDYHTWLERLHAPYAFETLPRVLLSVIDAVARSG